MWLWSFTWRKRRILWRKSWGMLVSFKVRRSNSYWLLWLSYWAIALISHMRGTMGVQNYRTRRLAKFFSERYTLSRTRFPFSCFLSFIGRILDLWRSRLHVFLQVNLCRICQMKANQLWCLACMTIRATYRRKIWSEDGSCSTCCLESRRRIITSLVGRY